MSTLPDILWLNVSPSFLRFDQPLIRYLSKQKRVGQWEYRQNQDEPTSLDIALTLLHDYLKTSDHPIHLVGHSTAGLVGLLYSRKYPEKVQSLTLLSVGVNPAVDWQAHYYVQFQLLPCTRQVLLTQMVKSIFGHQNHQITKGLVTILEQDLAYSPSPHSLYKRVTVPPKALQVPLMVCGCKDDIIVDSNALQGWKSWLKECDRLWEYPEGGHFCHYFHPQRVGRQIVRFWESLSSPVPEPLAISS
ncbi:hypothetical protein BJP34_11810 [Moorena producens PAL-8-15-08-1]|uniref:AB hydrolase-1 domain-containing protein n=1 Tax=Moorena producens PAL-8-15-08-1 TaxID=1458985 RepID=A0A1D8TQV8_9CYAN|nr:alpha/beta hydrolase [Moorena producens]AOX00051.1 hypothetical protein BJP34_11810 [Moorena producens PAL-8-15-08-1]